MIRKHVKVERVAWYLTMQTNWMLVFLAKHCKWGYGESDGSSS